ncbi:MAG: hypothetical protein V5A43_05025 [Haloarculaceae archaeon]
MDWHLRTLVRIFLVVGGLVYVVSGVMSGSLPAMALGAAATALGAVGLWWEFRDSAS